MLSGCHNFQLRIERQNWWTTPPFFHFQIYTVQFAANLRWQRVIAKGPGSLNGVGQNQSSALVRLSQIGQDRYVFAWSRVETPALGSSASLLCLMVGGAWLMSYESYVILCDLFTGFSDPRQFRQNNSFKCMKLSFARCDSQKPMSVVLFRSRPIWHNINTIKLVAFRCRGQRETDRLKLQEIRHDPA